MNNQKLHFELTLVCVLSFKMRGDHRQQLKHLLRFAHVEFFVSFQTEETKKKHEGEQKQHFI